MRSDHVPFFYLSRPTRRRFKNLFGDVLGPLVIINRMWAGFSLSSLRRLVFDFVVFFDMALPKWSTMTDESQVMVKKTGVGLGVGILVVWIARGFVKAILPLVFLGGAGYVAWKVLNKQ